MTTWSLSGVDADRWFVDEASNWRVKVTRRGERLEIPNRHGFIPVGLPVFEAPPLTLVLEPLRSTLADLDDAADELESLLSAQELTVTRTGGNGIVATQPAELEDIDWSNFTDVSAKATATVVLALPGVFFRGPEITTAATVVAPPTTVTLAELAGGTAPIVDAVARVRGPAGSIDLVDEATGTGLSWAGATLADTQYRFLDAASLRTWVGTASAWSPPASTSPLNYPGPGRLQLRPRMEGTDPADRRTKLTVSGTGFGPTTALAVRARPAYF
jgi:hypothetical protein